VLFKVNEGLTLSDPPVRGAYEALAGLSGHIDVLRSWRVERNLKSGPTSCDFALVADVDDLTALQHYIDHPAHQAVVTLLRQACTWISVDLPVELPVGPHG
jgi:hypothetical protein